MAALITDSKTTKGKPCLIDRNKTADGQQFMVLKDWVNPTSPLVVFMSDWSTELMKLHKIWLFDGTFKTAPTPFSQVNFL